VIVFALVTWGIALFGTFAQLVAVSAMARLIFSATTCLAVPVLRRKRAHEASRFIIPGGFVIPVLAAAVSVWLLSGIAQAQAVAGAAALLTGGLLYSIFSARRAKL
jgi:amino acid transporter